MKKPTKAIICAAGLGTRFLPQTKAMPKEMLPVVDRPVVQLIVEEAVAAGVTDIIIVTGSTKRSIEDHFDRSDELETELRERGKSAQAEEIKRIAELANFIYIRQKGSPKGNARPILNARHLINDDEPFFVFFADDFFRAETPRAKQLLDTHILTGKTVISLIEVHKKDADKYGMARIGQEVSAKTFEIKELIEKPGEKNAPSSYASVGGYLLTPGMLPILEALEPDSSGEIGLAYALNKYAKSGEVLGKFIEGTYHDTGDPLKYIQALVDVTLAHPVLGKDFEKYLKNMVY